MKRLVFIIGFVVLFAVYAQATPIARTYDRLNQPLGKSIGLYGALSSDASGGTLTYAWTVQAGTGSPTFSCPTCASTYFSNTTAQTYILRLTVTNSLTSQSGFKDITVEVKALTALVTVSSSTAYLGEAVKVDASGSNGASWDGPLTNTSGTQIRSEIDFGEGESFRSYVSKPGYAYRSTGVKTITVTTRNPNGQTATNQTTITISAFPTESSDHIIDMTLSGACSGTCQITNLTDRSGNLTKFSAAVSSALTLVTTGPVKIIVPAGAKMNQYVVPAHSTNNYITVTSSGTLPAADTRQGASATQLFTFYPVNINDIPIYFDNGAHHWRFIGAEATRAPADSSVTGYALVQVGDYNRSLANEPHHVILDRCWFHALGASSVYQRALVAAASSLSVLNSTLNNVIGSGPDAQGINIGNSSGAQVFYNNYLEGQSQAVLMGGGYMTASSSQLASSVTFRHCDFSYNPAWEGIYPTKWLFEIKYGTNVIVDQSILEHTWAANTVGYSHAFWCNSLQGFTYDFTDEIQVTRNLFQHVHNGVGINGLDPYDNTIADDPTLSGVRIGKRYLIAYNLFDDIRDSQAGGMYVDSAMEATGDHNTWIFSTAASNGHGLWANEGLGARGSLGVAFTNNNMSSVLYRIWASGYTGGTPGCVNMANNGDAWPGYILRHNMIEGATGCGATNVYPSGNAAMLFTNFGTGIGGDYRLQVTSPGHNFADGGIDTGPTLTGSDSVLTITSHVNTDGIWAAPSITPGPDPVIVKTHSGNFTQGQTGTTYTITVSNGGTASTSGTVTVTETVPSGLTATAISGTGWACTQPSGTCTRSDALAAGNSYPVLTLTVNVAGNAGILVTNSVTVSGGGDVNAGNNTANDPTTVLSSSIIVCSWPTSPRCQ